MHQEGKQKEKKKDTAYLFGVKKQGRWAAFLLLFILCAGILTGCGKTESAKPEAEGLQLSEQTAAEEQAVVLAGGELRPEAIPPYSGEPFVVLNDNMPLFAEEELTEISFETYSDLDDLGRCGAAWASVGQDLMPTEKRGDIGRVKPSGWHSVKYDNVDGKSLYNRCHLLGYQLTAENANEKNLITGTRYMNVDGMLPFENMVADYVKETGNHVAYRVTPIFRGDNLIADGVQMEGYSVEDDGESVCFHVFAYNVQPGIEIDYATGESWYVGAETEEAPQEGEIRGNARSKIYHCPGQAAYETMADSKHLVIFHSEKEAMEAGYRKAKK